MIRHYALYLLPVKALALCGIFILSGCAFIERFTEETCKTHAYLRQSIPDYLSTRFPSNAHVRLGIVPFTVPANLSTTNSERPGLDTELTRRIHSMFLEYQEIPIIEVLPRHDWAGKKDEFFGGNHRAIQLARDAGYDLVMVGYVEPLRSTTELVGYSKVLDTSSGVTLWYGRSTAATARAATRKFASSLGLVNERSDLIYSTALTEELARCVVKGVFTEEAIE